MEKRKRDQKYKGGRESKRGGDGGERKRNTCTCTCSGVGMYIQYESETNWGCMEVTVCRDMEGGVGSNWETLAAV